MRRLRDLALDRARHRDGLLKDLGAPQGRDLVLVGEIRDEYDREEEPVRQVDDDTFIANALVSIHDLGRILA